MLDTETTCRIPDPENPNNGGISVRVLFTQEVGWENYELITPYGVFRLDNDAEIDYHSLSKDTQNEIIKACEKEITK